jgi:hypothetical protein
MSAKFIIYFILLSTVLAFGLFKLKGFNKPLKLLLILIVLVWCSEITGRWISTLFKSSLPVYHFLIPLQFMLYLLLYMEILNLKAQTLFLFKILLISGLFFSIINSLFIQTLFLFPSNSLFLLSIFLVICSLIHFLNMLRNPLDHSPLQDSFFWFSAGNLIFYCLTFFIFGFFNPLLKLAGHLPTWAGSIIFSANLLLYSSYFMSFWFGKKTISTK